MAEELSNAAVEGAPAPASLSPVTSLSASGRMARSGGLRFARSRRCMARRSRKCTAGAGSSCGRTSRTLSTRSYRRERRRAGDVARSNISTARIAAGISAEEASSDYNAYKQQLAAQYLQDVIAQEQAAQAEAAAGRRTALQRADAGRACGAPAGNPRAAEASRNPGPGASTAELRLWLECAVGGAQQLRCSGTSAISAPMPM